MPNQGIERWVPSDCTAGLVYPHSIHILKGSVQVALISSGDGVKSPWGVGWRASLDTLQQYGIRPFDTISFFVEKRSIDSHAVVTRERRDSFETVPICCPSLLVGVWHFPPDTMMAQLGVCEGSYVRECQLTISGCHWTTAGWILECS